MKIAIPTSDRLTVFKRSGRTKEFAICEIENGSWDFLEFRINPHQHEEHNHDNQEHNHQDILQALKDCDALLVWAVGPHFKEDFDAANIPIYKTKEEDLKEAISRFATDMLSHQRI